MAEKQGRCVFSESGGPTGCNDDDEEKLISSFSTDQLLDLLVLSSQLSIHN
jgi:hypothetical protein